ncbi:MAG: hypothetical protein WBA16_09530 [Nonlabens sp.]
MTNYHRTVSIVVIALTTVWFLYAIQLRHPEKWQYLTAGAVNFIMAIIINRQFTDSNYNYLGIIHVIFMTTLASYGYFFL